MEVEEESLQDHLEVAEEEVEEEAVEPLQVHQHSQESWEAIHQNNSTAIERKANRSSSTSSCTEE